MEFLVNNLNVDNIKINKPKKANDQYLISKIKYETPDYDSKVIIQFPKMKITHLEDKNIILKFDKNSSYTNKCIDFLKSLEYRLIEIIHTNTLKWFNKEIPKESIKNMFKPMINENMCMKFVMSKNVILNELDEPLKIEDIIENICLIKYLTFSKETVFIIWEIQSIKLNKKRIKEHKKEHNKEYDKEYNKEYNFIDSNDSDSEDENLEFKDNLINNNSFF